MAFDKKGHGIPRYEDRKERANELLSHQRLRENWMRADHIVDQVYCDLCNGISRSDIILKFANCQYDGQEKSIKERTAQDYISSNYARDFNRLRGTLKVPGNPDFHLFSINVRYRLELRR